MKFWALTFKLLKFGKVQLFTRLSISLPKESNIQELFRSKLDTLTQFGKAASTTTLLHIIDCWTSSGATRSWAFDSHEFPRVALHNPSSLLGDVSKHNLVKFDEPGLQKFGIASDDRQPLETIREELSNSSSINQSKEKAPCITPVESTFTTQPRVKSANRELKGTYVEFFGPINQTCLALDLPQSAVKMIDTHTKLALLNWTQDAYGLDCEWRPNRTKGDLNPVSILTIACESVS